MTAVVVYLLSTSILTTREISRTFRGTDAFFAFQVDFETKQLIDYVDRYIIPETGVDLADVTERFDVVWSRAFGVSLANPDDPLLSFPNSKETISALQSLLTEIEEDVFSLDRSDTSGANEIKRRLRDVLPLTQKLALSAKDYNASVRTDYLRLQAEQSLYVIVLIIGTLLFGTLGAYSLMRDRRRSRQVNMELEERVKARTRSLANANEEIMYANESLELKIAEIEASQSALQDREDRLSQAARLARLGYYSWNVIEERCDHCSQQHARSFGMSPEEYVSKVNAAKSQLFLIVEEDRKMVEEKYAEMRTGKTIEFEARVNTPTGIRRLREIARPVFDEFGGIIKEVGTSLDVTEQHDIELQLFESQRMDSIGKLAGGMAHDFNNILAVILGNLELLEEAPDDPDRHTLLAEAISAAFRGRDLTLSMLSFARRAPLAPTEVDLNKVVQEMEPLLRRTLPENIALETSLTAGPWSVRVDRSLLESALLNLAINARDAMPKGGHLTIETSNLRLNEGYLGEQHENLEPGRYLMLAVTDTGHGIDQSVLSKIFEPFFTTKEIAVNSGLGLSMVQGFLKQSGGTIRVYTEIGDGTTFKLFFPVTCEAIDDDPQASPKDAAPLRATGRVLLVEDEDAVRKVLKNGLERSGLEVVTASDSSSAEKAFKSQRPFDLMVTDIVMPGDLQGPALAKKLRKIDADLPVIFLSGYPKEAAVHGNGLKPDDVRLMKPVSRKELIEAVLMMLPK
jgi:signal transduction histidine kinase/chaperonin cofactor prefoldin